MKELVDRALHLVNTQNVVKFQGSHYLQVAGLAMGQAPSLDIVNIWGTHFEEHLFHTEPTWVARWVFYGRYIDDCLGIVYADSMDHTLHLAKLLVLDKPLHHHIRIE